MSKRKKNSNKTMSIRDYMPDEIKDESDENIENLKDGDEHEEDQTETAKTSEQGSESADEESEIVEQNQETVEAPQEQVDVLKVIDTLQLDDRVRAELKNGYLRMQDYTKKTQAIATERKQLDEYNRVRPIMQKIFQDPKLLDLVLNNGETRKPQEAENDGMEIPEDPKEFFNLATETAKKETMTEVLKMIENREREARVTADIERAGLVDPRLNEDEQFARVISNLVSNDKEAVSGNKSYEQATREAIKFFDDYISTKLETEKTKLSEKAKQKKYNSVSRGGLPGKTVSSNSQPKSIREAYEQAFGSGN